MAVACAAYAQPARPEMPPAKPLERADNHLDVVYLPQRQVGDWEDRWLRMNVHVPAGGGPFPCIVFVHGGGYGGGDKDGGLYGAGPPPRELLQRAVDEGYVAVNLNYILGRGTKPQVFWDYKTAIRFLRAHAGRFKLDPGRIAAWGFSAGGWLASTAGFSGPEDSYACPPAAQNIDELSRQRPKGDVFPVQMDDPRAAKAEFSSRVSAIVADLWQGLQYLSADDPPMLTYVGEGARHKHADAAREARVDFTAIELTDPKFKGQSSLHVPPHTAAARRLDGSGTSTLADEAFAWLASRLRQQPRSIPPEAQPNRRTFADRTEVHLVAPAPNARVHFTTDGSQPGPTSPVFEKPLVLTGTTTIRAVTVREGERPSGVAAFTLRSTGLKRYIRRTPGASTRSRSPRTPTTPWAAASARWSPAAASQAACLTARPITFMRTSSASRNATAPTRSSANTFGASTSTNSSSRRTKAHQTTTTTS